VWTLFAFDTVLRERLQFLIYPLHDRVKVGRNRVIKKYPSRHDPSHFPPEKLQIYYKLIWLIILSAIDIQLL
jgi:hypothetical protein